MNNDRLTALAYEIAEYKQQKQFAECIQKMARYARDEKDAAVKTVLLTAQATCALQMGDLATAKNTISKIDRSSLTPAESIYVDQVLANILQEQGKLVEADAILSASLKEPEILREEHRDALHEMLARRGFILAHLKQYGAALKLLNDSLAVLEHSDLTEGICLYQGYCLQALGRLEEAEKCLRKEVDKGLQDLAADVFYRLGAVMARRSRLSRTLSAACHVDRLTEQTFSQRLVKPIRKLAKSN